MDRALEILSQVARDVTTSISHNWPYLLAGVVVASFVQVYVGSHRFARWLRVRTPLAVLGAVALATLTPFCSCGTTAVVLGAMASAVPWAPVVAFMVSSPLTSPAEYIVSTGLFGAGFATTYVVGAIVVGLAAGAVTALVERSGALAGQARVRSPAPTRLPVAPDEVAPDEVAPVLVACGCSAPRTASVGPGGPGTGADGSGGSVRPGGRCAGETPGTPQENPETVSKRRLFLAALLRNTRFIAVFFVVFASIGFLVIHTVPTETLTHYLGGDSFWSVPLAATLGIPVYVSSEGSLPLVASLMDGGMGPGPALAFLTTGAGTSIGAISGMLTIARWRVVALVVGSLWAGSVLLGWLAPIWL